MSFSAKIFILQPENSQQVKSFLTNPGQKEYDEMPSSGEESPLKIYIEEDEINDNEFGEDVNVHIDDPDTVYNKDQGTVHIKETKEIRVQIFDDTRDMQKYIAVFCPEEAEELFKDAIKDYLEFENDEIFDPVSMDLDEHREQLEKKFGNIVRADVKSMDNDLVNNANLQGNRLQKGADYNRFTEEYNGELSTIYVDFKGLYLMINSNGRLYTPSSVNGGFFEKVKTVKEIVEELQGIEDMSIGSYQTSFDTEGSIE